MVRSGNKSFQKEKKLNDKTIISEGGSDRRKWTKNNQEKKRHLNIFSNTLNNKNYNKKSPRN